MDYVAAEVDVFVEGEAWDVDFAAVDLKGEACVADEL